MTCAVLMSGLAILCTAGYLGWRYSSLPDLLPVHFRWDGLANGWQYRTLPRVLMPVVVQLGLATALGGVSALLLYRGQGDPDTDTPDAAAARTAAEAVFLIAAIWIAFQAYAAAAIVRLWAGGLPTLGRGYTVMELLCLALTVAVGARAQTRLGHPTPLPYEAEHWRYGHLYCNSRHPALFVPTRDGRRWTLNFGRPVAVVLLGSVLVLGLVLPPTILALALR